MNGGIWSGIELRSVFQGQELVPGLVIVQIRIKKKRELENGSYTQISKEFQELVFGDSGKCITKSELAMRGGVCLDC